MSFPVQACDTILQLRINTSILKFILIFEITVLGNLRIFEGGDPGYLKNGYEFYKCKIGKSFKVDDDLMYFLKERVQCHSTECSLGSMLYHIT